MQLRAKSKEIEKMKFLNCTIMLYDESKGSMNMRLGMELYKLESRLEHSEKRIEMDRIMIIIDHGHSASQ